MSDAVLSGTVALVSGASSGIGAGTALALAELGADVALVARRADRLDIVAEQVGAAGGRVVTVVADLTDQAQAAAAVETAVDQLGRLDILVNNAGVMLVGAVAESPIEEWDRMIAINLQALLYLTHAALPHLTAAASMDPRHVADIVNVSSVSGRTTRPGNAVYSATKWGVGAFAEILRQELEAKRVRVSLVEPGGVETELMDHMRPEMRERLLAAVGSPVRLRVDDVSEAITYIVSRPRGVAINEILIRPLAAPVD